MESFEWKWKSRDGLEMYGQRWEPENSKAVVVLVHGHGEHVNRYGHVAEIFTKANYALQGFDLRGHGQSTGRRGHTPKYQSLMSDIADFIDNAQKRYPNRPMFLYGHSMGGNQVINYVLRSPDGLKGAVVTSPWLKLAFEPNMMQVLIAKGLNRVLPSLTMTSPLDVSAISRDQEEVRKYAADPLIHDKASIRLYNSIQENGLWALEHADELKVPMFLMHGSGDKITSASASQEFAQKAGALVTLRLWDGLYHEIHNEPEKAEVIQAMVDWLDKQMM